MNNILKSNMLKIITVLLLAFIPVISGALKASDHGRRHFYGGYIGIDLSMANLVNQFEASPLAGYRITPWLHAGAGAKYQYYYDKRLDNVFRAHIFGPLIFTDIIPVQNLNDVLPFRFLEAGLYVHGEVNMFNLPVEHFDEDNRYTGQNRFFRPTWVTGIGIRSVGVGGRHLHIMMIFDLSGHERRIYERPALRIGYFF